jgi:mono/diheme cytochrome c family protein
MNRWNAAVAGAVVLGLCATLKGQTPSTVKDGVYTDDQAKRGQAAYTDRCSACHGDDLNGGGFAPALNGDTFSQSWVDRKLDELVSRIKDTMPADKPGSLTPEMNGDIVAFLLKSNGYTAGERTLATDPNELQQITITKP